MLLVKNTHNGNMQKGLRLSSYKIFLAKTQRREGKAK